MALSIFAGAGVVGSLIGGSMADRIGLRRVIFMGFLGLTLFLPLLLIVDHPRVAALLLVPVSLSMYFTYSPTIVLGQSYLPARVGFSSGVTLGLSFAIGGAAVPLLGSIADAHGLPYAMASIAVLPMIVLAIALTLPQPVGDVRP
jgi:FSR family fosmidomycin resistance protein-like MFS transporter